MDDRDVAKYWDENAPEWIRAVRAGWDVYREYVNNPAFFGLLPDLGQLFVLDVGCGEGHNTRKIADLGPERVVGVDVSEAMLQAALQEEALRPRGIEYHLTSGSDLRRFRDGSFDVVLSTMVLMDMPDYKGCIREIARVLAGGGLFQFSITHPCVQTRAWRWILDEAGQRGGVVVGDYFSLADSTPEQDVDEWFFGAAPAEVRQQARRFRVPRFFRTLSEYVNTLTEAGFRITQLAEPHADDEALRARPGLADTRLVPYFLIFQCRKARPATPPV